MAADWWSVGVMIFEMLAGMPTFRGKDLRQTYQKVLYADVVFTPEENFSAPAKELLLGLIHRCVCVCACVCVCVCVCVSCLACPCVSIYVLCICISDGTHPGLLVSVIHVCPARTQRPAEASGQQQEEGREGYPVFCRGQLGRYLQQVSEGRIVLRPTIGWLTRDLLHPTVCVCVCVCVVAVVRCRVSDGPWVPDPGHIYSQKKKKRQEEESGQSVSQSVSPVHHSLLV
jgi:serine/threonine protein kinase